MENETTIRTHSSALNIDFVDFDGDGRIDQLTSTASADTDALSTFDIWDLPTDTVTRYFSPLVYREGRFDEKALSLHGVAIDSLREYLYQMQIHHLHPNQAAIEQTAETYAQNGDVKRFAEYLTDNYVPEAHHPITNPIVAAARAAKTAGLDLAMVHRDVVTGTRDHAESIIENAMTDLTSLRDRKLIISEAFSILALIDETTLHGYSKKEWEAIFELDQRLMKFREEGILPPFLSNTLIQIKQCQGQIIKGYTRDLKPFRPYAELSQPVLASLESYSDILQQNRLSAPVKESIYQVLSEAVAGWYYTQIAQAMRNAEDPIRSNSPLYWKMLNDNLQKLPEDFFARIQVAYTEQYSDTMLSIIKQGLVLNLEQSRDVKLAMAHMLQGESWLCDALDMEIELLEAGASPQKQINWLDEIRKFERQSDKLTSNQVGQRYDRLSELYNAS